MGTDVVLHPPLKKGFLFTNRSLVAELWNGFLLFMLLFSSAKKGACKLCLILIMIYEQIKTKKAKKTLYILPICFMFCCLNARSRSARAA